MDSLNPFGNEQTPEQETTTNFQNINTNRVQRQGDLLQEPYRHQQLLLSPRFSPRNLTSEQSDHVQDSFLLQDADGRQISLSNTAVPPNYPPTPPLQFHMQMNPEQLWRYPATVSAAGSYGGALRSEFPTQPHQTFMQNMWSSEYLLSQQADSYNPFLATTDSGYTNNGVMNQALPTTAAYAQTTGDNQQRLLHANYNPFMTDVRRALPEAASPFAPPDPHSFSRQPSQLQPPVQLWPTQTHSSQYTNHRVREPTTFVHVSRPGRQSLPNMYKSNLLQYIPHRPRHNSQRRHSEGPTVLNPDVVAPSSRKASTKKRPKHATPSKPRRTLKERKPETPKQKTSRRKSSVQQIDHYDPASDQQVYEAEAYAHNEQNQSFFTPALQYFDPMITEPPPPTDPFETTQPIVSTYEDYKWPVQLFSLTKKAQNRYSYAQAWLAHLAEFSITSDRWWAHITRGFIQFGTAFTFLVLHNAAQPFAFDGPPETTTSIGVYGFHWQAHSDIFWTTYGPNIRHLIELAEWEGWIEKVCTWSAGDLKASERRFHRAYWLAAKAEPLRNLLRRSEQEAGDGEVKADEETLDDGFEVTEEDVESAWGVTDEESMAAWKNVQFLARVMDNPPEDGYDHVMTGNSEDVY